MQAPCRAAEFSRASYPYFKSLRGFSKSYERSDLAAHGIPLLAAAEHQYVDMSILSFEMLAADLRYVVERVYELGSRRISTDVLTIRLVPSSNGSPEILILPLCTSLAVPWTRTYPL